MREDARSYLKQKITENPVPENLLSDHDSQLCSPPEPSLGEWEGQETQSPSLGDSRPHARHVSPPTWEREA